MCKLRLLRSLTTAKKEQHHELKNSFSLGLNNDETPGRSPISLCPILSCPFLCTRIVQISRTTARSFGCCVTTSQERTLSGSKVRRDSPGSVWSEKQDTAAGNFSELRSANKLLMIVKAQAYFSLSESSIREEREDSQFDLQFSSHPSTIFVSSSRISSQQGFPFQGCLAPERCYSTYFPRRFTGRFATERLRVNRSLRTGPHPPWIISSADSTWKQNPVYGKQICIIQWQEINAQRHDRRPSIEICSLLQQTRGCGLRALGGLSSDPSGKTTQKNPVVLKRAGWNFCKRFQNQQCKILSCVFPSLLWQKSRQTWTGVRSDRLRHTLQIVLTAHSRSRCGSAERIDSPCGPPRCCGGSWASARGRPSGAGGSSRARARRRSPARSGSRTRCCRRSRPRSSLGAAPERATRRASARCVLMRNRCTFWQKDQFVEVEMRPHLSCLAGAQTVPRADVTDPGGSGTHLGAAPARAAARRQLPLTTRARDRVHDARGRDGVGERRLTTRCKQKILRCSEVMLWIVHTRGDWM